MPARSLTQPAFSRLALPALAGAYFTLGVASLSVVGLAGPIAAEFGGGAGRAGLLVLLFAATYAPAAPGLQMLVGHLPRRALILVGVALIAAGAAGGALAPSFAALGISRVVMALGAALAGPMSSAAAAGLVPPERRGQALASVFAGLTAAIVLGVPLAAWMGAHLGWRAATGAIALLALAVGLLVVLAVPDAGRGRRAGLASFAALLGRRAIGLPLLAAVAQNAAQFATYALFGTFVTARLALDAAWLPTLLLLFGAGGVLGNHLAGMLSARVAAARLALGSLLALAGAFGLLAVLPAGAPLPVGLVLVGAWAVAGLVFNAPQQALLVERAGEARNLALALNASAIYAGMGLGGAIASTVHGLAGPGALPVASLALMAVAIVAFVAGGGLRAAQSATGCLARA